MSDFKDGGAVERGRPATRKRIQCRCGETSLVDVSSIAVRCRECETLRDQFAMAAVAGFAARFQTDDIETWINKLSAQAYRWADAMLVAREGEIVSDEQEQCQECHSTRGSLTGGCQLHGTGIYVSFQGQSGIFGWPLSTQSERERCAKIAEAFDDQTGCSAGKWIAARIRSGA